jgi:NAD(P)-dependent dehydrogenase (short-subunit alcohol dehydrogenase family)
MLSNYPFKIDVEEFKGKRVLITGGTKGMGRSIVQRFALSGAEVGTTARSPVPSDFPGALFVQADIGSPGGVQKVVVEPTPLQLKLIGSKRCESRRQNAARSFREQMLCRSELQPSSSR